MLKGNFFCVHFGPDHIGTGGGMLRWQFMATWSTWWKKWAGQLGVTRGHQPSFDKKATKKFLFSNQHEKPTFFSHGRLAIFEERLSAEKRDMSWGTPVLVYYIDLYRRVQKREREREREMVGVLEVRGKRVMVVAPPAQEEGRIDGVAFNTARALLSHGSRVVLVGDGTILQQVAHELCASDNNESARRIKFEDIQVAQIDLLTPTQQSVNAAVEEAWLAFGGIDVLLCFSTSTGPLTPFLETNEEHLEAATSLNFKCACLFSIAVGKKMMGSRIGGSFIFITSIIGTERGLFPGVAIPGASIAAVNYLTRAMALELGKHKIRVNSIARGLYESDALLKSLSDEVIEKEGKRLVPLGRWVNKENDLTSMILYLAADASSFITGTVVFVDGGQSLIRPRMRSYL